MTTTPNPTAEQIVHDAIWGTKLMESELRTLLANDSWALTRKAVAALRAHGLLGGDPTEEQAPREGVKHLNVAHSSLTSGAIRVRQAAPDRVEEVARALYEQERSDAPRGEGWISWERMLERDAERPENAEKYGAPKYRRLAVAALATAGGAPQEQKEAEDVVVFACGQEIPVSEFEADGFAPQEPSVHEHTWDPESTPPRRTCGCDEKPAPSSDRENLIAEGRLHTPVAVCNCKIGHPDDHPDCRVQEWFCERCESDWPCLAKRATAALAAPPTVDEEKLAEVVSDQLLQDWDIESWRAARVIGMSNRIARAVIEWLKGQR